MNIFKRRGPPPPPDHVPDAALPVVWLLGKTGAGKSSLVRVLTDQTDVEIGDGFRACTPRSQSYDFPPDQPLVRFLDTRGLGEVGYDPTADIAECRGRSHVVLVVCRLDDPVQGAVADALHEVMRQDRKAPAILVLTGTDLIADPQALGRAQASIKAAIDRAAGRDLPVAALSLAPETGPDAEDLDRLRALLLDALPAAGLLLAHDSAATAEEAAFLKVRRRVLFYSGVAGSSDVAPLIGAVSVPATQLAMLRELGQHYGVAWDRKTAAAFLAALGLGAGARFTLSYGVRQLTKLIPVVGQTVGAAAAGSISFAATYALGRAAAYFLHGAAAGSPPDEAALRKIYANAFKRSSHDTD
nr:GTPase [Palleronia pontilimi]